MKKQVIWAVDLSDQNVEKQESMLPLAKQLASYWDCKIQPVFVLNNKLLRMDIDIFMRLYDMGKEHLEDHVFQDFLDSDEDPALSDGEIILSRSYTRHGLVKDLIQYAEENEAHAILCSTRLRSKHYPSFLGGFTENLLSSSRIPIFSLHPDFKFDRKIETVLYATDLEDEEDTTLNQVLGFAKATGARVQLFFNPEAANNSLFIAPQFPSQKAFDAILENEKKLLQEKTERGENLVSKSKENGVNCELIIADSTHIVEESLLKHAEENKVDLIALSSKSNRYEGAIFGSVAKEILRQSKCPVWVTHK